MTTTVSIPRGEYEDLMMKASLFDHFVETEQLTPEELEQVENALKTPLLSKAEFLTRHPELS